jgi:predicted acetyltransferase
VTDEILISVPTADDFDDFNRVITTAFNQDPDEGSAEAERRTFEPERFLMAKRGDEIVGTAGIYTRALTVPGAVIPAAHVTAVSVAPTARRQGILTRFMHRQFDDIRAAGESVAVLWASEGRIYQRFGYGLAVRRLNLKVETSEIVLPAPTSGRLRAAPPAEVRDDIVKVYDRAVRTRTGWSERADRHWDHRLADPDSWRRGASALRAVLHEGDHGVDGYALWRVRAGWDDTGPNGEMRVVELVATTPAAYASLWRFVLTLDLTRTANVWCCAVDEPIQFLVNEPRKLQAGLSDALWLRVINVPAALAARRYARDVDLVIEVTDDLIPTNAGRWRLIGGPGGARCESTRDDPDLGCGVLGLGSAYLGGTPMAALAGAGLVRELRPGALDQAAVAFGWHRPPSVLEVF